MRKKLVAANWKMHGSKTANSDLLEAVKSGLKAVKCDVLICPPSIYLAQLENELAGTDIALGAQNAFPKPAGAFTGEVSFTMLYEFACTHVIVGHSERRQLFAESDAFVAEKFVAAQAEGLIPILCVGESQSQRENDETASVVLAQLAAVVDLAGVSAFAKAVIAYEPIWAIGTGLTASPEQAQEVHALIREYIGKQDRGIADGLTLLYGGSVKADNAAALFRQKDIDGALVGGASLKAEEFVTICQAFD
jgi:triosephosphate isomerase